MRTTETSSSRQRRERKLEQRTKRRTDVDGLEPDTLVIDGHIFVECPEPANARDLSQHADPYEEEAWRMQILCEGCDHNKQARIYLRFTCVDCGNVTWYQQTDGATIN